jgi:hypothetical protein
LPVATHRGTYKDRKSMNGHCKGRCTAVQRLNLCHLLVWGFGQGHDEGRMGLVGANGEGIGKIYRCHLRPGWVPKQKPLQGQGPGRPRGPPVQGQEPE